MIRIFITIDNKKFWDPFVFFEIESHNPFLGRQDHLTIFCMNEGSREYSEYKWLTANQTETLPQLLTIGIGWILVTFIDEPPVYNRPPPRMCT